MPAGRCLAPEVALAIWTVSGADFVAISSWFAPDAGDSVLAGVSGWRCLGGSWKKSDLDSPTSPCTDLFEDDLSRVGSLKRRKENGGTKRNWCVEENRPVR